MTARIEPPTILQDLTECLNLCRDVVIKVKKGWDEERLFRLAAILAANKIQVPQALLEKVSNDLKQAMHDYDDIINKPHHFYMKLGIIIKSSK